MMARKRPTSRAWWCTRCTSRRVSPPPTVGEAAAAYLRPAITPYGSWQRVVGTRGRTSRGLRGHSWGGGWRPLPPRRLKLPTAGQRRSPSVRCLV